MAEKKGGGDGDVGGASPDVFREPLIRYLAYVGEIGRTLATFSCPISKNLPFFTGLTTTYILCDTFHKGFMALKINQNGNKGDKGNTKNGDKDEASKGGDNGGKDVNGGDQPPPPPPPPPPPSPKPIAAAFDRFAWHTLASMLIPSFALGRIRIGMDQFMGFLKVQRPLRSYIVALSALSVIPLIIKPIDEFSDHTLDMSLRKLYNPTPPPPPPPPKDDEQDKPPDAGKGKAKK